MRWSCSSSCPSFLRRAERPPSRRRTGPSNTLTITQPHHSLVDIPAKKDGRSSLQLRSSSQQAAKVAVGPGYAYQHKHRRRRRRLRYHASNHDLILVVAKELLRLKLPKYIVSNRPCCYMHHYQPTRCNRLRGIATTAPSAPSSRSTSSR